VEGYHHSNGSRFNDNREVTRVSKEEEALKGRQTSTGRNQHARPYHVVRECSGGQGPRKGPETVSQVGSQGGRRERFNKQD
jgi:hypothetical protein